MKNSSFTFSGLAKLREGPNLDPGTERSVRQCIRQLQLVRNVWVDILPEAVYANTMGFLIDEFTQAVVTYVTDAEDISAQAASELVKIFGIVDDRLPKLFNVSIYLPPWVGLASSILKWRNTNFTHFLQIIRHVAYF